MTKYALIYRRKTYYYDSLDEAQRWARLLHINVNTIQPVDII